VWLRGVIQDLLGRAVHDHFAADVAAFRVHALINVEFCAVEKVRFRRVLPMAMRTRMASSVGRSPKSAIPHS
jgi:hypothetical protein